MTLMIHMCEVYAGMIAELTITHMTIGNHWQTKAIAMPSFVWAYSIF